MSGCKNADRVCCGKDDALMGFPLAMAYVPWQHWDKTYDFDKALCVGTIFPELDMPFRGYQGGGRR